MFFTILMVGLCERIIEVCVFGKVVKMEMDPDDFEERLPLSKNNSLEGKLYLNNVSKVIQNEKEFRGKLSIQYDVGDIMNLEIGQNSVYIVFFEMEFGRYTEETLPLISWRIYADSIVWESILSIRESDGN